MNTAFFDLDARAPSSSAPPTVPCHCEGERIAASYLLISPSGVLYDDTLWWRWLLQMLSRFGMNMDAGAFSTLWQLDYYDDVCCGRRDFFDSLREFLSTCGMHNGQIDELCAAGRLHWKRLELDQRSFPQTARALDALATSGWRLGLLVNGPLPQRETRRQLQRMGILSRFEHIVCSSEIPTGLTEIAAWPAVLSEVGVGAESIAYVAHDNWLLQPAKRSGMTTIACQCEEARADYHVGQLGELSTVSRDSAQLQAA